MLSIKLFPLLALCLVSISSGEEYKPVSYEGHKVLTAIPKSKSELRLLHKLRNDYGVDLWNEPVALNVSVMMRVAPELAEPVQHKLVERRVEHFVAFENLQKVIDEEREAHSPAHAPSLDEGYDFGRYHTLDELYTFLRNLAANNPSVSKLEEAGKSFENRPIYVYRLTSGSFGTKPAILMECGIHAREWTSVAACSYLINKLATTYGKDSQVTSLLDKYEFYIVNEANPDGYDYTWKGDRMWRKTRSRSSLDWLGVCRGVDANRNFDIEHCGVGTSRKPCDDIFCGDKPFSESESRALRDLMVNLGSRLKAYFSVHAYSQLWMTPYGISKQLPPNYNELQRVGNAGVNALKARYGTVFRLGTISNIIYEAAGSSVDYAYVKQKISISFALELRDTGRSGFFLPKNQILPASEETTDGLLAAVAAL